MEPGVEALPLESPASFFRNFSTFSTALWSFLCVMEAQLVLVSQVKKIRPPEARSVYPDQGHNSHIRVCHSSPGSPHLPAMGTLFFLASCYLWSQNQEARLTPLIEVLIFTFQRDWRSPNPQPLPSHFSQIKHTVRRQPSLTILA